MEKPKILIVEDDSGLQRQLRWAFDGYRVLSASDRKSALEVAIREQPPVVLLDLGLPPDADGPREGMATLAELLEYLPDSKVIMMTGQNDRSHAVQAVASGAYDFYQKPVDADVLSLIVERAYGLWRLEAEHRALARTGVDQPIPGFLTSDTALQKELERVRDVAASDMSVLVTGESGTGKELIARGIHTLSRRRDGPFVAINCAAIPEQLLESELFGYERGAFTGAVKTTMGRVEQAHGGTLFLDEIGDLSQPLQAKLLRFLQERTIERIGGRQAIAVDVRVVAATNRDLSVLIEQGAFRDDLYYRLSEYTVRIPPLRERGTDAVVIANEALRTFAIELRRPMKTFADDALAAIAAGPWPGNVRELHNRIKRALITARGRKITAGDLELAPAARSPQRETLRQARERAERQAIEAALALSGGNISGAARILEISRPNLYDLLRRHGLRADTDS
ncbi:MAG: PEP-CTERM-box response regulator transcription factor [Alphaproteobacteria bacterium]|nr:MAG: PEP-CTERM-box response regulator transcription factor [Alphaproteobacteria bacterium]